MEVRLGKPKLVDVGEVGVAIGWSMLSPPPGMSASGGEEEEWVEIEVAAELEPRPDRFWLLFWQDEDLHWPAELQEPVLDGETLRFSAAEEKLQEAWDAVKTRVAATNAAYTEHLSEGGRKPDDHSASRLYAELRERAQRRVDELS
jgi:hypothetical protein